MDYLKVQNWGKWQSYRGDRGQPPWIKIHRRLLRNPEWVSLSDAEKGQLVSLWILAADKDGRLPSDPKVLQKLCFLNKPPNLKKFISLNFIENNDAAVTSTGSQDDLPEAKAKAETEIKSTYMEFVYLTEEEHKRLLKDYGENQLNRLIEKLDNYIGSNPKKRARMYTDHNRVLRGWVAEELGVKKIGNQGNDKGDANPFLSGMDE